LSGPGQQETWWNRSESNRPPPDCQSGALPDELRSQGQGDRPAPAARNEAADEQRERVGWFTVEVVTHAQRLVRVERRGLEPRSLPCEGRILPVEISPQDQKEEKNDTGAPGGIRTRPHLI